MHDIINSKELIKAALGGYDFLVVFGASNKGREGLSILTRLDMEVRFFCDNDANKWGTVFCERGVISPDDLIALGKDVPVLIASMYEAEIREQMCRLGLVNIVNDKLGKLLERKRLECFPTLEITTVIGCKVNCRFCPQQKLITEYARTSDKRILSFDDYKTCIDKVPANMRIDFSGMAEPFLNDNCGKMMLYAHEKGHDMVVYSTLVNMKYDDLESIRGIPFKQFVIHLPDEERYETIPITEDYKLLLTHTIKTLRDNGVNVYFHCHATVDSDIKQLIDSLGESNFFYELNTRGGNLNEDTLKIFCNKGEIYCTTAGLGFNHNVLLPDGRVLLCCMDYSMRHILGNLLESDYISLHTSHETQKLLEGVKNENSMIICRSCSRARQEDILW